VPSLIARSGEGGPALPLAADEQPPELEVRGLTGGGFQMSLVGFLSAVRDLGVANILLTDGAGGAFLKTADRVLYCPALLLTNVASTAGAGDAFSATFAAYMALGRPAEEALRAATSNAASVVGHVDTQSGLLTRAAMDHRLVSEADQLPVKCWMA
jgi:ribokinase